MKPKRVDCVDCENFHAEVEPKADFKYSCNLGKRVMFRKPVGYWYYNDFLFPRYCNDYKEIERFNRNLGAVYILKR